MAKKEKKPKKPSPVYTKYKVGGDKVERSNPTCAKCGPGFFMASHKDRKTCGKCGYTEMAQKEAKADKKEEAQSA